MGWVHWIGCESMGGVKGVCDWYSIQCRRKKRRHNCSRLKQLEGQAVKLCCGLVVQGTVHKGWGEKVFRFRIFAKLFFLANISFFSRENVTTNFICESPIWANIFTKLVL